VAFKLHANRLFEKSKNHGIHVIKKDLDMVAGITWPVRTTGMVPNWDSATGGIRDRRELTRGDRQRTLCWGHKARLPGIDCRDRVGTGGQLNTTPSWALLRNSARADQSKAKNTSRSRRGPGIAQPTTVTTEPAPDR
jgi:hypothetical protein